MRIMFKRPVQFPLKDGKLSEVYAPDVEHDIPDKIMSQIEDSLLYKQLRGSGNAVPIKDTAPAAKDAAKDAGKGKEKAKEKVEPPKDEPAADETGGGDSEPGDEAEPPAAKDAGKKSGKKAKD